MIANVGINSPKIQVFDVDTSTSDANIQNNVCKKFEYGPLERGFAHTIGNALRRILLSNLPTGVAAIGIQIDGVQDEFTTISGVKEDVVDIVLNVKEVCFKSETSDPNFETEITLSAVGPGSITAGDIDCKGLVEVVNKDHVICTLEKGSSINMTITVGAGKGYCSAIDNKKENAPIGYIPIDAIFTPVVSVSYESESERKGQNLDYNKLILTVETNGTSSPEEVVSLASKILVDYMNPLVDLKEGMAEAQTIQEVEAKDEQKPLMTIDDLKLSVRASNCLKRAQITTLDQLLEKNESDLENIRNLGAKSQEEIKEKVKELGYSFKEAKGE